jgi:hypothetical protein
VLLQGSDLSLTYLLLERPQPDVYEANPLAAAVLARHGWAGLGALKLLCCLAAVAAALLVCRRRAATGAALLAGLCLAMAGVVGYSGALLARPPGPPPEVSRLTEEGARLDGRIAQVKRLQAGRAAICLDVLEGREDLASGVERMHLCLEEYGPALCSALRARLPDPADPGQVAAYLHHHASGLALDRPGRRRLLSRLRADMARRYPAAPRFEAAYPPRAVPLSWRWAAPSAG